jgi:hypothetical protein
MTLVKRYIRKDGKSFGFISSFSILQRSADDNNDYICINQDITMKVIGNAPAGDETETERAPAFLERWLDSIPDHIIYKIKRWSILG